VSVLVLMALERALSRRGHAVYAAATAMAGLEQVTTRQPDVVVLDLGLPDVDGTKVLGMIRGISAVPVIVATARDDEAEIVRVLDLGADDYMVKPFSAEQLEARLRAVLRRGRPPGSRSRAWSSAGCRWTGPPGRPPWTAGRWT
jgi:DNA-binding response OmpR family regulator